MSISVMTAIWKTCLFQGNTLNVLLAMADFAADDGGDIFPGIELLSGKCRVTTRTAQSCLRELEDCGVIEQVTPASGGRGKTTEYRIDLERVKELQGLHQAEMPECEHCAAKIKSAERQAAHRAKRVQKSVGKGETFARKGENPDQKGENSGAHIDNNHHEPSLNHQHTPPANAGGECGNVATLGREDLKRWPEFRSAIAATWPGGFPADNEKSCSERFGKLTRTHTAEALIDCARKHGAALTARQKDRLKSAGAMMFKSPSSWLRSGEWLGYLVAAETDRKTEKGVAAALARVRQAIGSEAFDLFRHELEFGDDALVYLDGIQIERGKETLIAVTSGVASMMLEKNRFKLNRIWKTEVEIKLVQKARPPDGKGQSSGASK